MGVSFILPFFIFLRSYIYDSELELVLCGFLSENGASDGSSSVVDCLASCGAFEVKEKVRAFRIPMSHLARVIAVQIAGNYVIQSPFEFVIQWLYDVLPVTYTSNEHVSKPFQYAILHKEPNLPPSYSNLKSQVKQPSVPHKPSEFLPHRKTPTPNFPQLQRNPSRKQRWLHHNLQTPHNNKTKPTTHGNK